MLRSVDVKTHEIVYSVYLGGHLFFDDRETASANLAIGLLNVERVRCVWCVVCCDQVQFTCIYHNNCVKVTNRELLVSALDSEYAYM